MSHGEDVKTSSLKKVPSYICLVSRRSPSFSVPHSFVSRLPFVWNVSGSSFPFPDSWSELLAAWRSGQRGERDADGSILMSPCLLGRDVAEQVERDLLTHTHTEDVYMHIHTRTNRIQRIHSHACMCGELSHTFFPFTLEAFT